MDEWQREEVRNEVRTRVRNEWIKDTSGRYGAQPKQGLFACECSFKGCPALISLTHAEYEAVRSDGGYFAIAINHENPEIDRLITEFERYSMIEKRSGEPRNMAMAADPRSGPQEGRA